MKTFFRHLLLFLIGIPTLAHAQALHNLDALERKLVVALGADIGEPGGPTVRLDRRLKLAACPADVTVDPPLYGAAVLRCAPIGWRIRVPLVAGGASRAGAVAQPQQRLAPVIRRGDPVDLVAGDAGFTVSNQMIAEQDGAPGDRIRVRADRSSPAVMVEVVDAGTVRLPRFK